MPASLCPCIAQSIFPSSVITDINTLALEHMCFLMNEVAGGGNSTFVGTFEIKIVKTHQKRVKKFLIIYQVSRKESNLGQIRAKLYSN